jgi:molybdate transport system substrate-binding protein
MRKKINQAGGRITSGNMTWVAKPDVYLAGVKNVQTLID